MTDHADQHQPGDRDDNRRACSPPPKLDVAEPEVLPAAVELAVGSVPPRFASGPEVQPVDRRPAAVYLARLAPSGRRTMRGALNSIAAMLSDDDADAFTFPWAALRYEHTQAIRAVLADKYAPATANKFLCALRGTLKAAWRLGLIPADDYRRACDLEPVRGSTLPAGRAIDPGEVSALFETCRPGTPADIRDAALLAVLYGGGLRRAEAAALDLADYDPRAGHVRVCGKGRKERLVHLPAGATAALDAWVQLRGEEPGALFVPINKGGRLEHRHLSGQSVRLIVRKRAQLAKVADCSVHDFRRTWIGELLDRGADISVVAGLAGHRNIQTTAKYDRRPEEQRRAAARLLHVPYREPGPVEDQDGQNG